MTRMQVPAAARPHPWHPRPLPPTPGQWPRHAPHLPCAQGGAAGQPAVGDGQAARAGRAGAHRVEVSWAGEGGAGGAGPAPPLWAGHSPACAASFLGLSVGLPFIQRPPPPTHPPHCSYTKFLVGRDGVPVKRFNPAFDPAAFEADVRLLLAGRDPQPPECIMHPGRKVCKVDL